MKPKDFWQRRPAAGGQWRANIQDVPRPLPLYRLPELLSPDRADEIVFVVEGEKDADTLADRLGLLATTCACGAGKGAGSDWSALHGRTVVLVPDNDDAGRGHAASLAGLLHGVPSEVRLLELPDLPPGGDVTDWVTRSQSLGDDRALADQLLRLADEAPPVDRATDTNASEDPADELQPWSPFPVDALPEPFASFVRKTAAARQCDPAAVAMPLLAAMAGTIGNTRQLKIWPDWDVPAVLWTAIVSPSGSVKSPAFRAALAPLGALEARERASYDEKNAAYEHARILYDADLADWKKRRRADELDDPPEKPTPPTLVRRVVDDTTIQALGHVLSENPRGVVLARDELSGWLRGFDQFHSASGADVARWLEFFNAGTVRVDRVANGHTRIPRAAVSVCGTIQDEILLSAFSGEHQANGLLARFLLARPPEVRRRWCSCMSATDEFAPVHRRFERLAELSLPDECAAPIRLRLSPEAEALYEPWFNAHNDRKADEDEPLRRATLAKIEELPGRLALVLALAAAREPESVEQVDAVTMGSAIRLADWFRDESARVVGFFLESAGQRSLRALADWIARKGRPVTAREVARGPREWREPGKAQGLLDRAVAAKLLVVDVIATGQRGGRPTKTYRAPHMAPVGDGDETGRVEEVVSPSPPAPVDTESPPRINGNGISWSSEGGSDDR